MEHCDQNNELLLPIKKIIGRKRKYNIQADPIHNSLYVTALTNRIMRKGKKSVAYKIVLDALNLLQEHTDQPANDRNAGLYKGAAEHS